MFKNFSEITKLQLQKVKWAQKLGLIYVSIDPITSYFQTGEGLWQQHDEYWPLCWRHAGKLRGSRASFHKNHQVKKRVKKSLCSSEIFHQISENSLRGCVTQTGSGLKTRRMDCSPTTRFVAIADNYSFYIFQIFKPYLFLRWQLWRSLSFLTSSTLWRTSTGENWKKKLKKT